MARRKPTRTYHHGQLRQALIQAAEMILAESGIDALTLRAAARRAGVSPAAPAHHFGSLQGLLTEVAILGFEALAAELEAGNARGGADPAARLREQGLGYVRFALAHPGRFLLMFRKELLDREQPRLQAAGARAFALLAEVVREVRGLGTAPPLAVEDRAFLLLAWSAVHGFAHLALEGQLDPMAQGQAIDAFVESLLPGVMRQLLP
jgi:AcrR family transcriptional regulator